MFLPQTKGLIVLLLSLLFLMSCDSAVKPPNYEAQRTFFLKAIEQVNQAGNLLQQPKLSNSGIKKAMALLDTAMIEVNSVDASFLKWLDTGLYQAFTAYLTKGIEDYRLGVELEDPEQQSKGIKALQNWWVFWQLKQPAILAKIDA